MERGDQVRSRLHPSTIQIGKQSHGLIIFPSAQHFTSRDIECDGESKPADLLNLDVERRVCFSSFA
jgi:hypothetical protein